MLSLLSYLTLESLEMEKINRNILASAGHLVGGCGSEEDVRWCVGGGGVYWTEGGGGLGGLRHRRHARHVGLGTQPNHCKTLTSISANFPV